jgi:hypothetical protein
MQSDALSIELQISLFPISLNVLVYAHVNVFVFTRNPCFPILSVVDSTLQWMEHLWLDAWPYFLGIKV